MKLVKLMIIQIMTCNVLNAVHLLCYMKLLIATLVSKFQVYIVQFVIIIVMHVKN